MCLDKLKEIGKSGLTKWANAMGYEHSTNIQKMSVNLLEKGLIISMSNLVFTMAKQNTLHFLT